MAVFVIFCCFMYLLFSFLLIKGWKEVKFLAVDSNYIPTTTVAIVLTVRNEEMVLDSILSQLVLQEYPQELVQIYIADDSSTDLTATIIGTWLIKHPDLLRKVNLNLQYVSWKGKKKWIASAIEQTEATLILTTDADCQIPKTWVKSMVHAFEIKHASFISGPVSMKGAKNFWHAFQEIEFSSLIGSGASAIGLQKPLMCNGANIGYARKAYQQVRGFDGNETIASGDDEFLMHKISREFGASQIVFCKDENSIIRTETATTWSEFYNQRKRWASKWENYTLNYVKGIAIGIFIFHLSILVFSALALVNYVAWYLPIFLWGTKIFFDYFYLKSIARFLSIDFKNTTFIKTVLIYPMYVVYFGIAGRFGTYRWKERIVTRYE